MATKSAARAAQIETALLAITDGAFSGTATFGNYKLYKHLTGDQMWVMEDSRRNQTFHTRDFYATAAEAIEMIESQKRHPALVKIGRVYVWKYGENGKETDGLVIA